MPKKVKPAKLKVMRVPVSKRKEVVDRSRTPMITKNKRDRSSTLEYIEIEPKRKTWEA